jgi:predicted transcriptional regulator
MKTLRIIKEHTLCDELDKQRVQTYVRLNAITQEALADELEISSRMFSDMLNGKRYLPDRVKNLLIKKGIIKNECEVLTKYV